MKLIYALLIFVFITDSYSQLPDYIKLGERLEHKTCKHGKHKEQDRLLAEPTVKNYDVFSYDLYLDWDYMLRHAEEDPHTFNGTNKIKLKLTENTKYILIDAAQTISINAVAINGEETQNFNKSDEILTINFEAEMHESSELEIELNYTYTSDKNIGLYLYPKDYQPGYYRNPETVAYTTSEPDEARYWYPCNDVPSDKALVSISAKVPKNYLFISNGLLSNTEEGNDYKIFYWKSRDVMASYLAVANASKYVKLVDDYTLLYKPEQNIELQYYVWPADTASEVYSPNKAFGTFPDMMKFFEESFGSYPFEKYAHVTVAPYASGGMEHQTATTVHRNWLSGFVEFGVAHELAHHWLGDLITCKTWQDIWINEGGATWSEALYYSKYGQYDKVLTRYKARYFESNLFFTPICEVNTNLIFGDQYALAYYKSGWFYHMMSEMLGRDNFLAALRELFDRYKFQSVDTDMFLAAFKEIVPNPTIDWDTFFNQWLKTPGHPIYKIGYKTEDYSDDSLKVYVSIHQEKIAENDVDFYKMPIRFSVTDNLDSALYTTKQFLNDKKYQLFEFIAPKGFAKVVVDPMSVLHQSIPGEYTLVESKEKVSEAKLYPNVIRNGGNATLVYNMPAATPHTISLVDLNGRLVKTIFSGTKSSSSNELKFHLDRFSPGAFFVQIASKYGIESREIFIVN